MSMNLAKQAMKTLGGKIYLVTGCSTGFGKSLIEEILERGDIAVVRQSRSILLVTG